MAAEVLRMLAAFLMPGRVGQAMQLSPRTAPREYVLRAACLPAIAALLMCTCVAFAQAPAPGSLGAGTYPGLFKSFKGRVKQPRKGTEKSLPRTYFRTHKDGQPTPFRAPNGQKAVLCLVHKAGSTRWKTLLFRAVMGRNNTELAMRKVKSSETFDLHVHQLAAPWLPKSHRALMSSVTDRKAPRIIWVRNPYSRLLSAFLDKEVHGVRSPMRKHGGPYADSPTEFKRFVIDLKNLWDKKQRLDPHYRPISKHCGLPFGFQYEFYLKVEEIDTWYIDLVRLFGFRQAVCEGWGRRDFSQTKGPQEDCFYRVLGTTCAETDALVTSQGSAAGVAGLQANESGTQQRLEGSSWTSLPTTAHAHGADKQLAKYYFSKEVVDVATHMLKKDLQMFGYPRFQI